MSIALKPKPEPNGNISRIFNLNNFYSPNDYASKADLLSYANLYTANFFQYLNTFASGLNFTGTINGITDEIFSYIAYIPNIIFELTNFSYDSVNNSTNITGNTFFETTSINTNCNIGSSLNVTNILSHNLTTNTIQVNDLNCRNLKLNNRVFNEVVAYFYINSVSLPLIKSTLMSEFISGITTIYTLHFTIMSNYRLDCIDINNNILFSYTNTTDNFIYFRLIPYNASIHKINLYDSRNILL
jgi:hypothetical protein